MPVHPSDHFSQLICLLGLPFEGIAGIFTPYYCPACATAGGTKFPVVTWFNRSVAGA